MNDDSKWITVSSRYETPAIIRESMDRMMEDFAASLPADSLARILYETLPKPPRSDT